MSEPTIRRKARRSNWTVIDNAIMNDRLLSFGALGLLTYLLSKPDNWSIMIPELQRRGGIGRDGLRSIMRQLSEAGYARLTRVRGARGLITGTVWEVSEDAQPTDAFSVRRLNRPTAQPSAGQPTPLVSTDSLPSTETAPSTDNVVVVAPAPQPADPPAAQDDDDGAAAADAAALASQFDEGHSGMLAIRQILAPIRPARALAVLASIHQLAPNADAHDIEAAAEEWTERWTRMKGRAPDPITASQLPEVVAAYIRSRSTSGRPGRSLVPMIER